MVRQSNTRAVSTIDNRAHPKWPWFPSFVPFASGHCRQQAMVLANVLLVLVEMEHLETVVEIRDDTNWGGAVLEDLVVVDVEPEPRSPLDRMTRKSHHRQ
jgi:hypothetical protein